MDIVKNGKEYRPDDWKKKCRNACVTKLPSPFIGLEKKTSMMQPNVCHGHCGEMLQSGLQSDMSITGNEHSTYIKRLFLLMM